MERQTVEKGTQETTNLLQSITQRMTELAQPIPQSLDVPTSVEFRSLQIKLTSNLRFRDSDHTQAFTSF